MPRPILSALVLSPLLATLVACGSGSDSAVANAPEAYRERLTEAWKAAEQGENPTQSCAVVVGLAVGRGTQADAQKADAQRAFELCYVDIPARYIEARVARAGQGEDAASVCTGLISYRMVMQMSLGSFADDLEVERSTLDARLADRITSTVNSHCASHAEAILGL